MTLTEAGGGWHGWSALGPSGAVLPSQAVHLEIATTAPWARPLLPWGLRLIPCGLPLRPAKSLSEAAKNQQRDFNQRVLPGSRAFYSLCLKQPAPDCPASLVLTPVGRLLPPPPTHAWVSFASSPFPRPPALPSTAAPTTGAGSVCPSVHLRHWAVRPVREGSGHLPCQHLG